MDCADEQRRRDAATHLKLGEWVELFLDTDAEAEDQKLRVVECKFVNPFVAVTDVANPRKGKFPEELSCQLMEHYQFDLWQ